MVVRPWPLVRLVVVEYRQENGDREASANKRGQPRFVSKNEHDGNGRFEEQRDPAKQPILLEHDILHEPCVGAKHREPHSRIDVFV